MPAATLVLAYHKPKGLLVTHRDELGRETVYNRLKKLLKPPLANIHWHAIGRLDADTTGLLLFTNDGELLHHVTQPSTHLPKTYRVLAKGLLQEDTLEKLRHGVPLTGGLGSSGPAEVTLEGHQKATSWLTLTIHEGKNRQVRRMFLAVNSQVIRLQRIQIGTLALDVDEDHFRRLTDDEIEEKLGYAHKHSRR